VGLKCSSRLNKDRGRASIFMSRILTATFSALVNSKRQSASTNLRAVPVSEIKEEIPV
jgi:hypothetical protein